MKLQSRVLLAQFPALMVLVALLLWGGRAIETLGRQSHTILDYNYRSVLAAERMKESIERLDSAALIRIAGQEDAADTLVAEHRPAFEAELLAEEGNLTEEGEAQIAADLRVAWGTYQLAYDRFLTAPVDQRTALYFEDLFPRFRAVKSGADRVLTLNQDAMVRRSDEAEAAADRAQRAYLGWSAIAVLGAIALSTWTSHRLTGPLRALGEAAAAIGEGQLDVRLPRTRVTELDQLVEAFDSMAHRLRLYRRANDSELARAREAAQAAIESLLDPVLVLTVKGELRGTNEAARRLLAIDRRARRLDQADPVLSEAIQRARRAVTEEGRAVVPVDFSGVVVAEGPGGGRALLPHATPINDPVTGELVGVTVLLQDVTRLRRLDELKGNLVATVAHELRTPLTSLGMALHLALDERVSGSLSPKLGDLLGAAREDVARLRKLVEDLLDLSRIQEGKLVLRREEVVVAELFAEVVETTRAAATDQGVVVRGERTGPVGVTVDRSRMVLALANLTSNAVRVAPAGSEVVLRAHTVEGGTRFEVDDGGPGVAAVDRERIFERFVRGSDAPAAGPGLGLYIAREVVRAHGGTIGVSDRPGGGARFWMEIPPEPAV